VGMFERLRPASVKAAIARRRLRTASRYDVYRTVTEIEAAAEQRGLAEGDLHELVGQAIREERPFLLGRPGSFEAKTANEYLDFRAHRQEPLPYGRNTWQRIAASGGFPLRTPEEIDAFASDYVHAVLQSDVVAIWRSGVIGSGELLRPGVDLVTLNHIDPVGALLRDVEPWTTSLEGKRVLVVHPFRATILAQWSRREHIPLIQQLFPECKLDVLIPPQTYAGHVDDISLGWEGNLRRLMVDVASSAFDVAIVGAGPYGLPIAAFIKRLGRTAIHLGGSTQLLFAIRGARWERSELYASAMDETWVRPISQEIPPHASAFEHAPYW
jgi:hypothetical protein